MTLEDLNDFMRDAFRLFLRFCAGYNDARVISVSYPSRRQLLGCVVNVSYHVHGILIDGSPIVLQYLRDEAAYLLHPFLPNCVKHCLGLTKVAEDAAVRPSNFKGEQRQLE